MWMSNGLNAVSRDDALIWIFKSAVKADVSEERRWREVFGLFIHAPGRSRPRLPLDGIQHVAGHFART